MAKYTNGVETLETTDKFIAEAFLQSGYKLVEDVETKEETPKPKAKKK